MFVIYQYMPTFSENVRSYRVIRRYVGVPICFVSQKIQYNINSHVESCCV